MSKAHRSPPTVNDFMFIRPGMLKLDVAPTRRTGGVRLSHRLAADPMLRQPALAGMRQPAMQGAALAIAGEEARWESGAKRLVLAWDAVRTGLRAWLPNKYKRYTVNRGVRVQPASLRMQSGAALLIAVLALGTANAVAPAGTNGPAPQTASPVAGDADAMARMVTSVRQDAGASAGGDTTSAAGIARPAATNTGGPYGNPTQAATNAGSTPAPAAVPPVESPTPANDGGSTGGGTTDPVTPPSLPVDPVSEPETPGVPTDPTDPSLLGGTVDGLTDVVDSLAHGLGQTLGL